ncbi:MAG: hypothetical protein JXR37_09710 [Kiritimatiellae bacterium]|nr:hypothetical protein [Kiritimatiellia bacterium]
MASVEQHDGREIRCRKLGHPVPFSYCRREANGRLCARILDCWWEYFDVRAFLANHAAEALRELEQRSPQPRIGSIVDLIRQARESMKNEE